MLNLYKHGMKEQLFFDLPMHAKRVGLTIKRQRYKCREYEGTFFEELPDIDKVELVAMHMWRPYKDAVNMVIPHAKIIIDQFHVVKLANESLEKIRKANREKVSAKERRQLMRDHYVLLTKRRDLNDFDDQIKLQVVLYSLLDKMFFHIAYYIMIPLDIALL
ncbi:ISL3 family transposase [Gracilibacillus sp. S3-1-1]|uniref:ISL3 family transposase n=1 Tax=Gracilibacillus pellucidus TaxID=3095368 RepID=A0ACC6M301_9BACI|nr:ISL3 family transposase [Gracilibacillus sp. S3-1-1]MDX8045117.1 ISL3 family transposase [Gracilibacillus sp. S3-1-1]